MLLRDGNARFDYFSRWIFANSIEPRNAKPCGRQGSFRSINVSGGDNAWIGHHQDASSPIFSHELAKSINSAHAEHDAGSRLEIENGGNRGGHADISSIHLTRRPCFGQARLAISRPSVDIKVGRL